MSEDAKGAVDGYYNSESGNIALYNTIQNEIENRSSADEQLERGIAAAKTEVECNDGTITVTPRIGSNGQTIYGLSGVQQVPNVTVTSNDNSIQVTTTTVGNNKNFDLSVNPSATEWIEVSSNISSVVSHTGVPIVISKDNGDMTIASNSIKDLNGLYHSSIKIDFVVSNPSYTYTDLTIEILKDSTVFKSFDCVVDTSKKDVVQTFVIDFDFEMNGNDYSLKYRTGGLSGGFAFKNYLHKVNGGINGTGGMFDNPILMTVFLMSENGNLGFTGAYWAGDGSWNTYGINNTTRYYRVTSLGMGKVSHVKFWNYNGTGKIRLCVMNLDGSIKFQSEWYEVNHKGEVKIPVYAESGQNLTIDHNTDYWIGICCYGLQLVSYNKLATSFDDSSLRYSVCIRNGGQFPQTGTGWDNPNTDAVNSVPTEIPCVYLVTSESN